MTLSERLPQALIREIPIRGGNTVPQQQCGSGFGKERARTIGTTNSNLF
jgi:hypothetical protein